MRLNRSSWAAATIRRRRPARRHCRGRRPRSQGSSSYCELGSWVRASSPPRRRSASRIAIGETRKQPAICREPAALKWQLSFVSLAAKHPLARTASANGTLNFCATARLTSLCSRTPIAKISSAAPRGVVLWNDDDLASLSLEQVHKVLQMRAIFARWVPLQRPSKPSMPGTASRHRHGFRPSQSVLACSSNTRTDKAGTTGQPLKPAERQCRRIPPGHAIMRVVQSWRIVESRVDVVDADVQ